MSDGIRMQARQRKRESRSMGEWEGERYISKLLTNDNENKIVIQNCI